MERAQLGYTAEQYHKFCRDVYFSDSVVWNKKCVQLVQEDGWLPGILPDCACQFTLLFDGVPKVIITIWNNGESMKIQTYNSDKIVEPVGNPENTTTMCCLYD